MRWFLFFGTSLLVQAVYWRKLHAGFERARQTPPSYHRADGSDLPSDLLPLSVVVAARNEQARLPGLLQALARQTHPDFEVVIADDASTDNTANLVRTWSHSHPNVKLAEAPPEAMQGKKHALLRAIAYATHDHLALTDADCAPHPDWLRLLAQHYAAAHAESRTSIFVGYAPYRKGRGFLNRLARYETFVTGFLTAAAIGLGRPYMAVGRNLAYSKSLFRRIGGFGERLYLVSGDDDLLVQEVVRQRAGRVFALTDDRTFAPSDAPTSWRAWLRQKRRHLSDGRAYPWRLQVHLALFHGTGTLLWLAPALAGWRGAGLLTVRLWVQHRALRQAAHALDEEDLLPHHPLLELGYALYNGVLAPLSMARELKGW